MDKDKRSRDSQYARSSFSRGHVTPAGKIHVLISILPLLYFLLGDMIHRIFKINTYIMSNVAPQYLDFNNGGWGDWEIYTQKKAKEREVLFVITGVTGELNKMYVQNTYNNNYAQTSYMHSCIHV